MSRNIIQKSDLEKRLASITRVHEELQDPGKRKRIYDQDVSLELNPDGTVQSGKVPKGEEETLKRKELKNVIEQDAWLSGYPQLRDELLQLLDTSLITKTQYVSADQAKYITDQLKTLKEYDTRLRQQQQQNKNQLEAWRTQRDAFRQFIASQLGEITQAFTDKIKSQPYTAIQKSDNFSLYYVKQFENLAKKAEDFEQRLTSFNSLPTAFDAITEKQNELDSLTQEIKKLSDEMQALMYKATAEVQHEKTIEPMQVSANQLQGHINELQESYRYFHQDVTKEDLPVAEQWMNQIDKEMDLFKEELEGYQKKINKIPGYAREQEVSHLVNSNLSALIVVKEEVQEESFDMNILKQKMQNTVQEASQKVDRWKTEKILFKLKIEAETRLTVLQEQGELISQQYSKLEPGSEQAVQLMDWMVLIAEEKRLLHGYLYDDQILTPPVTSKKDSQIDEGLDFSSSTDSFASTSTQESENEEEVRQQVAKPATIQALQNKQQEMKEQYEQQFPNSLKQQGLFATDKQSTLEDEAIKTHLQKSSRGILDPSMTPIPFVVK